MKAQIKMSLRFHHAQIRMTKAQKMNDNTFWCDYGERGLFVHCW